MSEPDNPVSRFYSRIKKHPVVTAITLVASLVVALSAFTNATRNVMSLFEAQPVRPDINGTWQTTITYPWMNREFIETFYFEGDGELLDGYATFLQTRRLLSEGKVSGDTVFFTILREEVTGVAAGQQIRQEYRGKIEPNQIRFTLVIKGSGSPHQPISFSVTKGS